MKIKLSRSVSRREFLQASVLSIGAVVGGNLLAGCAGEQPAEPAAEPTPAPQDEMIQLRYSHWGNIDEKASTKATLDAFMKENPNITVEQMYIPESGDPYLQKMTTMAASNTLPDAALFPDSYTLDWAVEDQFLDLSDIFTGEHEKVDAISYQTPDGKTVGVAGAQEISLIWYNKVTFDEAEMSYPPATVDEAWQWDDFLDIAKELTVDTNGNTASNSAFDPENIDRFGFQMGLWDMPVFAFMRSNGGDFISEDWLTLTLDKPENFEAIQAIGDLMNVHHVKPAYGVTGGVGSLSTDNALLSNKVAMVMDGQWVLETLNKVRKEQDLKFGIGVLPYMKEPVTTAVGGPIIAFKSSKHPAEALKLVSFIMDPNNTPDYIEGGLWMPNEKRWYTQADLLSKWIDNENHPEEYKTAVVDYSMGYVTRPMPIYRIPGWPGLWQIISPALERVWLGKATAEEAITEIIPDAEAYYDKEVVPLLV